MRWTIKLIAVLVVTNTSADPGSLSGEAALAYLDQLAANQEANLAKISAYELRMQEHHELNQADGTAVVMDVEHEEVTAPATGHTAVRRKCSLTSSKGGVSTVQEQLRGYVRSDDYLLFLTQSSDPQLGDASRGEMFLLDDEEVPAEATRLIRPANPRSPLLYGFGDGDQSLRGLFNNCRASGDCNLSISFEQPGTVKITALRPKVEELTYEVLENQGCMIRNAKFTGEDGFLWREVDVQIDTFVQSSIFFPVRWTESNYVRGPEGLRQLNQKTVNQVVEVVFNRPGAAATIAPSVLRWENPEQLVMLRQSGGPRTIFLSDGKFLDESRNAFQIK